MWYEEVLEDMVTIHKVRINYCKCRRDSSASERQVGSFWKESFEDWTQLGDKQHASERQTGARQNQELVGWKISGWKMLEEKRKNHAGSRRMSERQDGNDGFPKHIPNVLSTIVN